MRTKDIVVGKDYAIRLYGTSCVRATVKELGVKSRFNQRSGVRVEYVGSRWRSEIVPVQRVFRSWEEYEPFYRAQQEDAARAKAERDRVRALEPKVEEAIASLGLHAEVDLFSGVVHLPFDDFLALAARVK